MSLSVPTFTPGVTLVTTVASWRATNKVADPPAPRPNGGYNINPFRFHPSGNINVVIAALKAANLADSVVAEKQGYVHLA